MALPIEFLKLRLLPNVVAMLAIQGGIRIPGERIKQSVRCIREALTANGLPTGELKTLCSFGCALYESAEVWVFGIRLPLLAARRLRQILCLKTLGGGASLVLQFFCGLAEKSKIGPCDAVPDGPVPL